MANFWNDIANQLSHGVSTSVDQTTTKVQAEVQQAKKAVVTYGAVQLGLQFINVVAVGVVAYTAWHQLKLARKQHRCLKGVPPEFAD